MIDFILWFLLRAPKAQLLAIVHILTYFEDFIGLRVNIRYFFAPIFNDTTFFGRIMSLIVRSTLIICGAIALSIVLISLLLFPILWFASLIVWLYEPYMLAIPILATIYYTLYSFGQAKKLYPKKSDSLDEYTAKNSKPYFFPPFDTNYADNLLAEPEVVFFLQRLSIPVSEFKYILSNNKEHTEESLTNNIKNTIEWLIPRTIRLPHIFYSQLLFDIEQTSKVLATHKIDLAHLQKYLSWEEYEHRIVYPPHIWEEDFQQHTNEGSNVTWQGTVTPILNQYSQDITMKVSTTEIRSTRPELITEIENGLQKSSSASVLLVGQHGVGKETLVEIIAQEINKGTIKGFLYSKRIVQLDVAKLYAGATEKGTFEKRVEDIIQEIDRSGNIVLFLKDFSSALELSSSGTISLFSLLQEPISKNKLHIIGSVTPKQLAEIEKANGEFVEEFTRIQIPEPDQVTTTNILFNRALEYEQSKNVFFPYPTIESVYNFAAQYISSEQFPLKGLQLLEEVVTATGQQRQNTTWNTLYGQRIPILEDIVASTVSKKIHIAVGDTNKVESEKLLHLEESFSKKIIGQSDAVSAIAESLRRNRVGLRNKNKPSGSFLFVGPTGVGKTKMAKVLSDEYFGGENHMIRFDMSEFQNPDSLERLIGTTSQTSNYLTLTDQLRKQPYSLVLLDELEKAHPKILDVFLQVLDDARITDASGETVRCNEAIFIATSNAGTQTITEMYTKNATPHSYEQINKEIYHILSNYFRIEFLNRFDEIVIFKPLTPSSLRKIVNIELAEIAQQLYNTQKINVIFTESTINQVIKDGYNPELGARPLERSIQTIIESAIAKQLLQNKIVPGDTITI